MESRFKECDCVAASSNRGALLIEATICPAVTTNMHKVPHSAAESEWLAHHLHSCAVTDGSVCCVVATSWRSMRSEGATLLCSAVT